jgi:hypothetical protein
MCPGFALGWSLLCVAFLAAGGVGRQLDQVIPERTGSIDCGDADLAGTGSARLPDPSDQKRFDSAGSRQAHLSAYTQLSADASQLGSLCAHVHRHHFQV